MGTFPSASDYARPAPIPAEGIASVAPPQITMTSAETAMAAGRDAQQTAQDIDKFSLHIDTLLAQEAVNKLRTAKADLTYGPENGFMNVKGVDVLKPGPGGQKVFESYPVRFQAAADAIGGLLGGRAAMIFKAKADEEAESYKLELLRHTMQQTDVANKQIYHDGTQQDVTEAVRFSADPNSLAKIAERAAQRAKVQEATQGLPEGSLARPAISNIYRASIEDLIAKNNAQGALAMYNAFSGKLDGQDALSVSRQVKTLEVQQKALRFVGGLVGGLVGGGAPGGPVTGGSADYNIGNIVATNINYPGKGAPAGKFETFVTPEHGVAAAYGTIRAKAEQNGGSITFLDLMGGNGKVKGWAPRAKTPAEQNEPLLQGNNPEAYAARLAQSVGLSPTDPVPLADDEKMAKLLREMNATEKNRITVPEAAFARGIQFAKGDTSVVPTATSNPGSALPPVQQGAPGGPATGGSADYNIGNIVATNIFLNYPGKGAPAGKFETFVTPEHGVAAAYGTIREKAQQNGGSITFLDLIGGNGKVKGWAPRAKTLAEQNEPLLQGNDPEAYAARLAQSVGLSPTDPVPLADDEKMAKLLREMNATEKKGRITVPEAAFARGIQFAKGDTSVVPTASTDNPVSPLPPEQKGPPGFMDTRTLTIKAEKWRINAMAAASAEFPNDPAGFAAAKHQIDIVYGDEKHKIELAKNELYKQVQDWMEKPGSDGRPQTERPRPELWNQLTYEMHRSIDATLAHNAKGQDPPWTEQAAAIYARLSDLATTDPDKFRDPDQVDLMKYVSVLPKAQWLHLQEMKAGIQKAGQVEYPIVKAQEMGKKALSLAGVDTRPEAGDKDKALIGDFNAKLTDWLTRFQIEEKRRPKDSELQKQIDTMLIEGRTARPSFFERNNLRLFSGEQQGAGAPFAKGASGIQGTTPGAVFSFTVPEKKRQDFVPIYSSIPEPDRTAIETELKAARIIHNGITQTQWDKQQLVEETYGAFMKIPAGERQKIAAAMKQEKLVPTWTGVIETYNKKNGLDNRKGAR